MAKKLTKRSVNYRETRSQLQKCTNCSMYRPSRAVPTVGTCTLVEGVISKGHVCDRWEAR